jgi:hypothetical protein
VTRLASVVVVPWARWNATASQCVFDVPARERRPGAAVHVDVDEAGHEHREVRVSGVTLQTSDRLQCHPADHTSPR